MSYKADFGGGNLGDVSVADGATAKFCSYARVIGIDGNNLTFDKDSAFAGKFADFTAGTQILFHVSASPAETDFLGRFCFATILIVHDNILTTDTDIEKFLPADSLENYYAQIVTVPCFQNLTLKEGAIITPPVYNPFKFTGGILAFKCSETLNFDGGLIELSDCGIAPSRKNILRPETSQERDAGGLLDSSILAGRENLFDDNKFLLNSGDGAVFICAKHISATDNTRIGNPKTHGVKNSRAAEDAKIKPSNVTNLGGSSIFIACETFQGFSPAIIAKYRNKTDSAADEGRGLARCFIATDELLPHDDMLYHADFVFNPLRLARHNIFGFGNSEKTLDSPKGRLNNFAEIISVSGSDMKFKNISVNGLAPLCAGATILIRAENDFRLAKVLGIDEEFISVDVRNIPRETFQAVSVLSVRNISLGSDYKDFLCVRATDYVDLRGVKIHSAFICAGKIILDDNTRFENSSILIANSFEGLTEKNFVADVNLVFGGTE